MSTLQTIIEQAFEQRQTLSIDNAPSELRAAVDDALSCLDSGLYRVAEQINGEWVVNQWLKKAVLLSFKLYPNQIIDAGFCQFYDKVPLKYQNYSEEQFQQSGVRVVPHAMVRRGAFIAKNTVLMPSYVNVGAYIDEGVMVDTWAFL
jgi:2,3,4,5-tetrahydropyridine-2-carboxylate N-succinyltransferase